jgi:hypothetical protein
MLTLVVGIIASLLLGWVLRGSSLFAPLLVVGVPCGLVAALGVRRFNIAYLKASVGVRAESRVARRVSRLPFAALVNGVLLDRGDVDHVVLGPCLAVLETKHGRGPVDLAPDGSLRVSGRRLPRDPIAQAAGNAARLSRRLNRPVDAIVVVVDGSSRAFRTGNVWVCSLGELPGVLAALPSRLDAPTAERVAVSLPVAG